jgi:hypothetical protein
VGQQVDSNLVELARKWSRKFMRYRRFLEELSMETQLVHSVFYQSLLLSGCEEIGRDETLDNVYMRCGGRLVVVKIGEFEQDIQQRIGQLKVLSEDERSKLLDWLPLVSVRISFNSEDIVPSFDVLGDKPIYLTSFEGISFYLNTIFVHSSSEDNSVSLDMFIEAVSPSGSRAQFVTIGCRYKLGIRTVCNILFSSRNAISMLRGYPYLRQPSNEEIKQVENSVVEWLSKNYHVVDNLLRNAEGVLSEGIKALVTLLLY